MNTVFGKFFVITFLFIIGFGTCFAQQDKFKPELSIGPFAGVALSKVSFNPKIKENFFTGGTVGVKFRYITENHLGFLLEPNLSIVGWKENFEDYNTTYGTDYEYSRSIQYLDLPFMTHIYFGNKYRFFINLGPVARFKIGEKETANFSIDNEDERPATNGAGAYGVSLDKAFDYGLAGGLGMELRTKIGCFMLEGRYYYGLGDVFNNHKKDYYAKSANEDIYITLSYLIPIGR